MCNAQPSAVPLFRGQVLDVETPHPPLSRRPSEKSIFWKKREIQLRSRQVLVLDVEDATEIPTTIGDFLAHSRLPRGRWRVKAFDFAQRDVITFFADWRQGLRLQFGLWDLLHGGCIERVDEPYPQTSEGLSTLRAACKLLMKEPAEPNDGKTLAIFCVDEATAIGNQKGAA